MTPQILLLQKIIIRFCYMCYFQCSEFIFLLSFFLFLSFFFFFFFFCFFDRVNPVAIGTGRILPTDLVLGGYHVPAKVGLQDLPFPFSKAFLLNSYKSSFDTEPHNKKIIKNAYILKYT